MDKVTKFLNDNSVCCLATCSGDTPRASAMEYIMVNGGILFATDANSIKAKNLKANNKISFSAHNMPFFVTIDGTTAVPTDDEIAEFNKILFERHPEFKDMMEHGMMGEFTYYKIIPKIAYYNDFSEGMTLPEVIEY